MPTLFLSGHNFGIGTLLRETAAGIRFIHTKYRRIFDENDVVAIQKAAAVLFEKQAAAEHESQNNRW